MTKTMKALSRILLLLWLFLALGAAFTSQASVNLPPESELKKGPLPVEGAFAISFQTEQNNLLVEFTIKPYYYLYQNKISLSQITASETQTIEPEFRGEVVTIQDEFFGEMQIYKNRVTTVFDLAQIKGLRLESLYLNYQGCWEGGVCYPPQSLKLNLLSNYQFDDNISFNPNAKSDFSFKALTSSYSNQSYFVQVLENYSIWLMVLIFFLLGFFLAFTPCVLPTFPLIYSVILKKENAGQDIGQQSSQLRNFYLALSFVLASALTYALIGLIVGLLGQKIQFLLQKDWINLIAIFFLILLAGAMFGFYQIQLPRKLQNQASEAFANSKVGYYSGASLMGVFSALIIGPCLAPPLAGVIIFLTNYGSAEIGALALFVMGVGMGMPLILFSSSLSKIFQKRGDYMVHIERLFGFLILLVAIYLADRLISDRITLLLYGLVILMIGFYLIGIYRSVKQKILKLLIQLAIALSFVIGTLEITGFFINAKYATDPLAPWLNQELKRQIESQAENKSVVRDLSELNRVLNLAKESNQIAVVKFVADWCISCKVIEKEVFENPNVLDAMRNHTLIEVDVTEVNQASSDLLDYFRLSGPPAVFFYNQNGLREEQLTFIGAVKTRDFLNNLNIMKP